MIHNDKQQGRPAELYTNTKAAIEALTGLGEGAYAYATDTNEFGTYSGTGWTWGQGGGGGAGGNVTTTGPYDSPPGSPTSGDLHIPSSGPVLVRRYSGSVWEQWGARGKYNTPAVASYAWVNQGTATATDVDGGVFLTAPAVTGGNTRILKKAQPATPYKIFVTFIPHITLGAGGGGCGVCWRESSSGKLALVVVQSSDTFSTINLRMVYYSNPTTYGGTTWYDKVWGAAGLLAPMQLCIENDGANRKLHLTDGTRTQLLFSQAYNTLLTPDEVGFFATSENATYPMSMHLLSWREA